MDPLSASKSYPKNAQSKISTPPPTATNPTKESELGFKSNISSDYIYNAFMTGDNSIPEYKDYLNTISQFGYCINKIEKLGNSILNAISSYVNQAINDYGMGTSIAFYDMRYTPPIPLVTVDISYQKADGTTVNETLGINEAIGVYNASLKAIQHAYKTKIYPEITSENPNITFPPKMNLPDPIAYFDPPGPPQISILNPLTQDLNDYIDLTQSASTVGNPMTVSTSQTYLEHLQANTSQIDTVSNNFTTFMVNEYRKLKTAFQALSNILESMQTKLDQILSQNIS